MSCFFCALLLPKSRLVMDYEQKYLFGFDPDFLSQIQNAINKIYEIEAWKDMVLKDANSVAVFQTVIMRYFTAKQSNPTSKQLQKLHFRF